MDFFRTWIIPPVIGALIGYFTNWLAIKMLFRPLNPVYIGKFRLPFTPGILPRERNRLTESVGDIVSRELLTPEVFETRLKEPSLQARIEESVSVVMRDILARDAGKVLGELSASGSGAELGTQLGSLASLSLGTIANSAEFRAALSEGLSAAVREVGRMPVGALFPVGQVRKIAEGIAEKAASDDTANLLNQLVDRLGESKATAASPIIPLVAFSPLYRLAVRSLYSALLPIVGNLLSNPRFRARMEVVAMDMIRRAIQRLGPIQRLIVGAANYEKTLEDTMPATIADLSGTLIGLMENEETASKVTGAAVELLETRGVAAGMVAGFLPVDELKPALREFLSGLGGIKAEFADRVVARFASVSDKKLTDAFPGIAKFAGEDAADMIIRTAGGEAGSTLASAGVRSFLSSYAKGVEGRSIGEILGWRDDEVRALSSILAAGVTEALSSQAGRLVEALNVRSMVVDRLNSLNMAEVERLILQVVNDELLWITILGGILGAVIGIFQSVLSIL